MAALPGLALKEFGIKRMESAGLCSALGTSVTVRRSVVILPLKFSQAPSRLTTSSGEPAVDSWE